MVTVIFVAPAMTWLFVRISPVELMTMPVPAAVPDVPSVVVMSTSAGSTLPSISARVSFVVEPVLVLPVPVAGVADAAVGPTDPVPDPVDRVIA